MPRDGATVGEIVVRGNVVMKGYYNDPEATAVALRGGYFHSGDAAVVHPDGYVEIRDRIKDVIISGGENISSVEVEGVLLRHPAVQEVAVVGMPDAKWGEAPHAFVVLKPARRRPRTSCARSRASGSRTSSARTVSRSSPSCRRPRPARFRSSCCAGGSRRSRRNRSTKKEPPSTQRAQRTTFSQRSPRSPRFLLSVRIRTWTVLLPKRFAVRQFGMKMSRSRPLIFEPVSSTV